MTSPEKSTAPFDVEHIRSLVELMVEHDLGEVDLRQGEDRIRLCRGSTAPVMMAPAATPLMAAPPPAAPAAAAAAETPAEASHLIEIKSPTVGTYYSRPNPKAEAFVKVGDHVEPETTVCIIEAMKLFNEIPAEVRGRIVAVLVDDEETVDVGKPLFKVDPNG